MSEYIARAVLDVNGRSIEDFKAVSEKEVELAKQVNLMNKTGFAAVTPRYGVTVDYVVPSDATEFDWTGVKNGRLTLDFESGRRITYSGVYTLKIGEAKVDGENEMVKTIDLGATGRAEE